MGLLSKILSAFGSVQQKGKGAAGGVQADDISNVIGAMRGDKQDKIDLANRAKDIIPGQIDDIVIDGMVSGGKSTSSKKSTK